MNYTIDGTTKRYVANPSYSYGSFTVSADDKHQFGCEGGELFPTKIEKVCLIDGFVYFGILKIILHFN